MIVESDFVTVMHLLGPIVTPRPRQGLAKISEVVDGGLEKGYLFLEYGSSSWQILSLATRCRLLITPELERCQ